MRIAGGVEEPVEGELLGLAPDCGLRLRLAGGVERSFQIGELKLRPVDSPEESAKLSVDEQEA
jgi:hypothetical protein